MPNLLQAAITIEGTRPLLWNHFGPDTIPLEKQEKSGVAGNDPDEWRTGCLPRQHHDRVTMQLVPEGLHRAVGHTGGVSVITEREPLP
jgi:hypothetical protein